MARRTAKPMTEIKKAWQRADRLKRIGVTTVALERYRADLAAVNANQTMSRQKKIEAKRKIAKTFNESGLSTLKEIQAVEKKWNSEGRSARAQAFADKEGVSGKAKYLRAKMLMKAELEARAFDLYGGEIYNFLTILNSYGKAQTDSAKRRALTKFLNDLTDAALSPDMSERISLNNSDDVSRFRLQWLRDHYRIMRDKKGN